MASYRLLIDGWHPARLNDLVGCHPRKRARLKAADRDEVRVAMLRLGAPRGLPKLKRRVRLTLTFAKGERMTDVDAHWKSLLDALKACGAIFEDSYRWCVMEPVVHLRGDRRGTLIELEDVE